MAVNSVSGVNFTLSVENSNGRKLSSCSLEVAGYKVDSGTQTRSYNWSKGMNQTLIVGALPLMVGPVPVTIAGSVGGGGNVGFNETFNKDAVGVSGQTAVWVSGSASAGVGAPFLNVALRADLQLGKTSLNALVSVAPGTMSGRATLDFDPVNIDLGVVVQSGNKVWYRQDLAKYAAPSNSVPLLKL